MDFAGVQSVARLIGKLAPQIDDSDNGFHFPTPSQVPAPVKPLVHDLIPLVPHEGPSTLTILVGVGVALLSLGLFLLLRSALYNHMIERRAVPSSANGASWAFYAFLAATALTAIVGFVVGMWGSIPFLAGGGAISGVTLIFFLVSYMGAMRKTR